MAEELIQSEVVELELHSDETINLPSMYHEDRDQHHDEIKINHSKVKPSNIETENNTSTLFGNYTYVDHTFIYIYIYI